MKKKPVEINPEGIGTIKDNYEVIHTEMSENEIIGCKKRKEEEFINKLNTDEEFSKRWKLTI